MKALILCGGKGTRLRPITWFTPKPLIKITGKCVLEYIVDHLNHYGIYDIAINLHYKPLQFIKTFGSKLLYSYEPKLLGEEGTINSLRSWFRGDYLLVQNGDTLTDLDINQMFRVSQGKNVKFMDGDTYAGVRIIRPDYYEGQKQFNYYDKKATWLDMGTFKNLRKAKNYVKTISNLRDLSEQRN